MESIFEKSEQLLGKLAMQKLKYANVCIVGVGGVGGSVAEMLARTGVGNITLVDGDTIALSNLNRQIFTAQQYVNLYKAQVMKRRIVAINPECKVQAVCQFVKAENISIVLKDSKKYDYVIDCIDDIDAKVALITFCKKKNINIVSALGAGNRFGLPSYTITDLFETKDDPLAKKLRSNLRKAGVEEKVDVAISLTLPDKKMSPVASVMWHPTAMACVISAFIVNQICQKENETQ